MGLLGEHERGPLAGELESFSHRHPLSPYLQYRAYEECDETYHNTDNSKGHIWECAPLAFLSDTAQTNIAALLRQAWPREAVISVTLYPDPDVRPTLERYNQMKSGHGQLGTKAARMYADHLLAARSGFSQMSGIRLKHFRVLFSVKAPGGISRELKSQIRETLSAAGLAPRNLAPPELLAFLRTVFNDRELPNPFLYNPDVMIGKQVVLADTLIREDRKNKLLWLGKKAVGCLTPNVMGDVDTLEVNSLTGGFRGFVDDETQVNAEYLWTTSISFRTDRAQVKRKAGVMMAQRATGSIAKDVGRRVKELSWVLDDIEELPYCDVMSSFFLFGDSVEAVDLGLARVRDRWEKSGKFIMQRDDVLLKALFLSALPMGVVTGGPDHPNLELMQRDFPMRVDGAAGMLPIQGDFAGRMAPAFVLVGRKGQLVSCDLFDPAVSNHNFLVAGGSGSGKSFIMNFLVSNYADLGCLIRLVDIGASYQKQAKQRKGRYLEIGDPANPIVLNPFHTLGGGDTEDQAHNRATIVQILLAMAFSGTGTQTIREYQFALMKAAVDYALDKGDPNTGIARVQEFLMGYTECSSNPLQQLAEPAQVLGFQLGDWVPGGRYGKLFNGPSTFDISSDPFVVLELEKLQNDRELFGVMSLQVLNAMTQDIYLSDRSERRFLLFDEAWKYLISSSAQEGPSVGNSATAAIGAIIEEAFRRARKYSASAGVAFQSPLDVGKMGKAGEVIMGNAAFKFWLQIPPEDWHKAVKRDLVPYQGLAFDLVSSLKSQRPRYSEVFLETPFGNGVARLSVDPWTYWMNTSSGEDFARFNALLAELGDAEAALDVLAGGV